MSKAIALIKFKKTGNIYYGCYNGISDKMRPRICSLDECFNAEKNAYMVTDYCSEPIDNEITDVDDVEIYSSHGDGFYWEGKGCEPAEILIDGLEPLDNPDIEWVDGIPEWAKTELKKPVVVY